MAASSVERSINPGCDVFVRWRPLLQEELERGESAINHTQAFGKKSNTWKIEIGKTSRKVNSKFDFGMSSEDSEGEDKVTIRRRPQLRAKGGFKGIGFAGVVEEEGTNIQTYEQAIQPLVQETILQGHTGSCFAYGMTGSGKTHTMMGYGEEKGMYALAAREILAKMEEYQENLEDAKLHLSIRFAELYNGHYYNLLDNRKQCQILEGLKGKVLLRNTEKTEDGRYQYSAIRAISCTTVEEVEAAIEEGLKLRASGTSSTHSQSSRSHAIIEMKIVTDELVRLENEYAELDGELTFQSNEVQTFLVQKKIKKLKKQMAKNLRLQKEEMPKHFSIGGQLVFCDLAGAEIGNTHSVIGDEWISSGYSEQQTEKEKMEAKKINLSLSALSLVLKELSSEGKKRVAYRNSPLTMFLRQYLQGDDCKSVMMAAVSPCNNFKKTTIRTLNYAKLLAETHAAKAKNKRRKQMEEN